MEDFKEVKVDSSRSCVCNYCGKSFPFQSVLLGHQRIHTGERPYQCEFCEKTFAQKGSLTIHVRRHTGEKPYDCQFCGKSFASQGNMKIHERQHTGVKPYQCSTCQKRFATVGSLKTHEVTHSDTKVHTCDECGKKFSHRTSLYTHKKRHAFSSDSVNDSTLVINEDGSTTPCSSPSSNASGHHKEKDKKWICKYCGKRFAFKHPMVAHERVHTGEKPFKCKFCGKNFGQQTSLIMHERSHTGERRYKCEICEKKFIQPAALHAHRRTHTGEKPYLCKVCPKAFAHATSLRQHQLVHTREALKQLTDNEIADDPQLKLRLLEQLNELSQYGGVVEAADAAANNVHGSPPSTKPIHTCFCGKSFAYLSILESHMRVHSGEKPFSCPMCQKKFAQKATMQVHLRTHTGERPYKCRFCDRTFAQYGTKSVHEKSHSGIRCYKCPVCSKMLSSPSALYTHKKTHGERSYQCELCLKRFTLNNYLKLHMKQVHAKEGKEHPCRICGKCFSYAGSLQVHLRCHSGERPFTCRYCPKSFTSQGNLQSHERIHTGIKPFQCKTCGKCFAQRSQLSVHESVHIENGKKLTDFTCKYCDKKFAYASSLYVHTRLHTGERPFKCKFCDKRFTNQGNMQVHERVHTRERPFRCPACDKCYAQKVGLKIHLEQCQKYITAKSNINASCLSSSPPYVVGGEKSVEQRKAKKKRLENLLPKLLSYRVRQKDDCHTERRSSESSLVSEADNCCSAIAVVPCPLTPPLEPSIGGGESNVVPPQSWKCLTLPTVLSSSSSSSTSSCASTYLYADSPLDQMMMLRDMIKSEYTLPPPVHHAGSFFDDATPPYVKQEIDDCRAITPQFAHSYDPRMLPTLMVDDGGMDVKAEAAGFVYNPLLRHHHPAAMSFDGTAVVRSPYFITSPTGGGYDAFNFRPASCVLPVGQHDDLIRNELYPLKHQLQHCLASISGADVVQTTRYNC